MGSTAAEAGVDLASALTDIEAFADALPQLIWVVASDGRLAFVNKAWRDYAGLDVGASFAQRLDLIHPDDRQNVQEVLRERGAGGEFRIRRADDGAYRWFLMRFEYVSEADGTEVRVGTAIDVHDRNRLS
ncbi:MAG: PAS domain-containing protein, partial [Candidatus Eremiobacteraeota bacterium]|nr:PAS domain-containing protein [Candidatus Eremiobacteraeota bacterium]